MADQKTQMEKNKMAKFDTMTADTFASSWIEGFNNGYNKWKSATQAVTENPCGKAASAHQKWHDKVTSAKAQQRFASRLSNVSVEEWRKACDISQSAFRVPTGGSAERKMETFGGKLLQKLKSVVPTIREMPSTSPDDMKDRMIAYFDEMSNWDPDV